MDTLPIPQPTGNPILDNPALKAQLAAQMQQTAQPQNAVMPPALKGTQAPMIHPATAPTETQPPAPVQMPSGGATPTLPQEQSSAKPLVFGPVGQVAPGTMAPKGTLTGDQQAREQSMVAGPGINSIAKRVEDTGFGQRHPLLGKIAGLGLQIPAMIGDIGLESLSPIARLALSHVPGTFAHQAATLHGENQAIAQDEANAEKEAQTAGFNVEVPLREAQTEEAKARTAAEPTAEEARVGRQQENALKDAQVQNYLHPEAKTAFEDWRKTNPNAPTEDFFKAEAAGKPEKEAPPATQVYDDLVKRGVSPEKALEMTKERPPVINVNAGNTALDRETKQYGTPYQKGFDAASAQLEKIDKTRRSVDAGYVGQGLAIPELLTSLVSGQGTGVRITQAELNAITRNRGIKGDAESFFNKISGKGNLTATDKAQIKSVLDDAQRVISEKQQIHKDALDKMEGSGSRQDIIAADREARQKLSDFEKFGHYAGQTVQLKGGQTITIKQVHPDGSFD
jgi:hypothetical protein